MPSFRVSLLSALILIGAVPCSALAQAPVEWYTDTGGGGALAQPVEQSKNGGAVAPSTATGPEEDGAESDISATPPISSPAQAEPVLGAPGAKPRPGTRELPESEAAQEAPTVTGGQNQDDSDAGLIGSLPLTGLQLAAVFGAGLCLLIAGAALRPRRHAPERA